MDTLCTFWDVHFLELMNSATKLPPVPLGTDFELRPWRVMVLSNLKGLLRGLLKGFLKRDLYGFRV